MSRSTLSDEVEEAAEQTANQMDLIIMRNIISILTLMTICAASRELNECPTTQEMLLCENLVTSKGFAYQVPQNLTVYLRDRHCEHGWYLMNGTFIADSTVDGEKSGSVVAVTPENLTVSTCANLQWQLHCDNIQFHCIINYTVKQQATRDSLPGNGTVSEDKEDANSPNWLTAVIVASVIVSVAILSVTIWIFLGKNIYESFFSPKSQSKK